MGNIIDMTGRKIGRWNVLHRDTEYESTHETKWVCKCDCGTIRSIFGSRLRNGNSHSCGCLQKELLSNRQSTHKETGCRIYRIWGNMKGRCLNPKDKDFRNYGARGITVCEEWINSYENFRDWALQNGYNEQLTLDRIDNNGNYCPENCRWATIKEQSRNTRFNHKVEYKGKQYCIVELSEMCEFSPATIKYRLDNGYSVEEALTTPLNKNKGVKRNARNKK